MKKVIFILISVAATMAACGCGGSQHHARTLDEILADDIPSPNPYDEHFDSMPAGGIKLRISSAIRSLPRQFNDINSYHLEAAWALGIEPVTSLHKAWNLRRPLVRIKSCREYFVDDLTHSYPFLVPEAASLLGEIGRRFNDTLSARGGGDYRLKVTSVLRTSEAVKRLRRRNVNATEASAHQFGTTFDISYAKFICDSAGTIPRRQEDLKNLLGEILLSLRDSGRCWVKYERKQGCFHITARGSNDTVQQPTIEE